LLLKIPVKLPRLRAIALVKSLVPSLRICTAKQRLVKVFRLAARQRS